MNTQRTKRANEPPKEVVTVTKIRDSAISGYTSLKESNQPFMRFIAPCNLSIKDVILFVDLQGEKEARLTITLTLENEMQQIFENVKVVPGKNQFFDSPIDLDKFDRVLAQLNKPADIWWGFCYKVK